MRSINSAYWQLVTANKSTSREASEVRQQRMTELQVVNSNGEFAVYITHSLNYKHARTELST